MGVPVDATILVACYEPDGGDLHGKAGGTLAVTAYDFQRLTASFAVAGPEVDVDASTVDLTLYVSPM